MRRYSVLIAFLALTVGLEAQILAGLRGNISSTWLLNKNVSDAGDALDYQSSFAGGGGIAGIYMFSEKSGIELDLGVNTITQAYVNKEADGKPYGDTKLHFTDVALLYHSQAETGFYFEVGPRFGFLGSVDERENVGDNDENELGSFKENWNSTVVSGVLGFGMIFDIADGLSMGTGLRFNFGLTDATQEYTLSEIATDDIGTYAGFAQGVELVDNEFVRSYEKTTPATLDLNIGLYYRLSE